MELSQRSEVQKATTKKISLASSFLTEAFKDGAALVFNLNSGATTLINDRALTLLNILRGSGVVSELAFSSIASQVFPNAVELSDILTSLEKSKLVIRD